MKNNFVLERILTEMISRYGTEKVAEIILLSVSMACITAVIAANLILDKPCEMPLYKEEKENEEEYYC